MITKRLFLSGIVTTAAVATASQYLPTVIEQRQYATVYGVGWDGKAIEHHIYEPMSVAHFGGTPAIDQFREVTAFVHAFPVEPMPEKMPSWRQETLADQMKRFNRPVQVQDNGFTNIVGPRELDSWRDNLRPDLNGHTSVEWVQEQLEGYRKFGGEPEWLTEGLRGSNGKV